jgi:hypothetical protein
MRGGLAAAMVALGVMAVAADPWTGATALEDPVAIVRAMRAESNAAIAAHDAARLRATLRDDFHETYGPSGAIDRGGDETARSFRDEEFKDPTFVSYVRIAESMTVAESGARVAEQGHWVGT